MDKYGGQPKIPWLAVLNKYQSPPKVRQIIFFITFYKFLANKKAYITGFPRSISFSKLLQNDI